MTAIFLNPGGPPALEDHFGDVLTKSQLGQRVGRRQLAEAMGTDAGVLDRWYQGAWTPGGEAQLVAAAKLLRLDAVALLALAEGTTTGAATAMEPHGQPDIGPQLTGVFGLSAPFGPAMTVNLWMILDPFGGPPLLFDTGAHAENWKAFSDVAGVVFPPAAIFLTHAHRDHVGGLPGLCNRYPDVGVYGHPEEGIEALLSGPPRSLSVLEAPAYAKSPQGRFRPILGTGEVVSYGGLRVTVWATPGHSLGGLSYLVEGLARPVMVVGDALFARSIGGLRSIGGTGLSYEDALQMIERKILSCPEETVLLPGHGPTTTVAEERRHNPFFAGRDRL